MVVKDISSSTTGAVKNRRMLVIGIAIVMLMIVLIVGLSLGLTVGSSSLTSSPEPPDTGDTEPWTNYRLRTYVSPLHYDIHMQPEIYNETDSYFIGSETIDIIISKATRYIVLHIIDIEISTAQITDTRNGADMEIARQFNYSKYDFWIFETKQLMKPEKHIQLFLQFKGSLGHNNVGAYKGHFLADNTVKYLVSTQFEPFGARMAFPCFDEPIMKAKYTMHMKHRKEYVALFNSEEILPSVKIDEEYVLTNFKKTSFKMSTYLVAWVVAPSYSQKNNSDGTRVMRYWAPTYRIDDVNYAVRVGLNIRKHFDQLLDFKSPLPKVDQISVPQFEAGAMENWGLIIYRETLFLYVKNYSLETDRYYICETIAHELAHTWFGNIVSPVWWTHLWLNEAFATQFAAIAADNEEKEFLVLEHKILENRRIVMLLENVGVARPIVMENVTTHNDMNAMFNAFVYEKGGQILHWLERLMGTQNYIRALQSYIKEYKFNNTETFQLLQKFDAYAPKNLNVSQLMNTWLYQSGYPIIEIEFDYSISSLKITQTSNHYNQNQKWHIPLPFITSENNYIKSYPTLSPSNTSTTFKFEMPFHNSSWLIFNANSLGYYRIRYDKNLLQRLANQFKRNCSVFSSLQRGIIIDDALELSDMNQTSFENSLPLIEYICDDEHYAPWRLVSRYVQKMERLLSDNTVLKEFMSKATVKIFSMWFRDVESPRRIMRDKKRELYMFLACYFGNVNCLNYTSDRFTQWLINNESLNSIPREVHKWIYYFGMKQNETSETWDKLWALYQSNATSIDAKNDILTGLMGSNTGVRWEQLLKNLPNVDLKRVGSLLLNMDKQTNALAWSSLKIVCAVSAKKCRDIIVFFIEKLSFYFNTIDLQTDVTEVLAIYAPNATDFIAKFLSQRISINKLWTDYHSKTIINVLSGFTC